VLGFGALGILGGDHVGVLPPTRDITLPTLADRIGGPWLVALVGATALLIVAGMVAALLISATTTYLRDVHRPRHGGAEPGTELRTARRVTLGIGIGSVLVGVILLPVHTHFLIPTTVNFAAAGVLPAVVYTLFWRRFNTSGLRWSVYGGLAVTAVLMFFSVGVSGDPGALFPSADWHFIPNADVGLVAVPVTFLLGYLGTIRSSERNDAGFAQLQVRALTGATVSTVELIESTVEPIAESTPAARS
jgi:cation/acetate symporter